MVVNYTINKGKILKAVVVKADDNHMIVMALENNNELISLGFKDTDVKYEKGQEIQIYFDGMIMESYPAQIGNVEKIKISKEKSDIQIPDSILRYCYSSINNVEVSINEFTNSSITLTITDTNEIPYTYSHCYAIYETVKNEEYTGVGQKIGDDTENSTAGFTGTGLEYIWKEVNKISDISSSDTEEILIYNLPNVTEGENTFVGGRKFDWTNLYGKLGSGEYYFILSDDDSLHIRIDFTIDEKGKLEYEKPTILQ